MTEPVTRSVARKDANEIVLGGGKSARKTWIRGYPFGKPGRLAMLNLSSVRDRLFSHVFSNDLDYLAATVALMIDFLPHLHGFIAEFSNVPITAAFGANQSPY